MYAYNQIDQQLVNERVQQFRDQTSRFLSGKLSANNYTALGRVLGPAVAKINIGNAIEAIVGVYINERLESETFLQILQRLGNKPFKEAVYDPAQ